MSAKLAKWEEAALHDAFEMFDKDRSGDISADELPDLLYYAEKSPDLAPYVMDHYDALQQFEYTFYTLKSIFVHTRKSI